MTFAGLALAAKAGLGAHVAALMVQSYSLMPAGHLPVVGDLSDWGLMRITAAFTLAFSLAAPFTIASVLYNLALGLVNRAMPQLQVTFIGAPALALAGLVLLALTLPGMMLAWQFALTGFFAAPTAALP
jgi:flagellar biosynthetic protein FliR